MPRFKAPGRWLRRDSAAAEWGDFVRFLEIADDQFAIRQVDVFENVIRYDRAHWCDDFGQLLGMRFSRKPKWSFSFPGVQLIELADFGRVWRAALRSAQWKLQVARSRAGQWGATPPWPNKPQVAPARARAGTTASKRLRSTRRRGR
jgi:hypothetical protein